MTAPTATPAPAAPRDEPGITIYRDNLDGWLAGNDGARHEWWDGMALPETTEDSHTAALRHTIARRERRLDLRP